MRESIFSYWEGVLASWWEITSLTQYLLSTSLWWVLCTPSSWVKGCNYKLLPLSLTLQLFSFEHGLGKVQRFLSSQRGPSHVLGTWGKVAVRDTEISINAHSTSSGTESSENCSVPWEALPTEVAPPAKTGQDLVWSEKGPLGEGENRDLQAGHDQEAKGQRWLGRYKRQPPKEESLKKITRNVCHGLSYVWCYENI